MTLDKYAFSIRNNAHISDYLTPQELIRTLIEMVSCGGNMLLNVGPTAKRMIEPIQEERLVELGEWLGINGQAIYNTTPWTVQNDTITSSLWYTENVGEGVVYGIMTEWPIKSRQVTLGALTFSDFSSIQLLGAEGNLSYSGGIGVTVDLPEQNSTPSQWAWALKILFN
jgi:alpha-L-fucosidase